jgi:hypothetical protein
MPADTKPKQTRVRSGELSPETRNAIIKALKDGESPSSIEAKYGISRTTVYEIKIASRNMASSNICPGLVGPLLGFPNGFNHGVITAMKHGTNLCQQTAIFRPSEKTGFKAKPR